MKHFLAFHTVFILNENIRWIEEFIIYYKHIGFDHFYLYDNEGTSGGAGSTSINNRYGFPVKTTPTEQDKLFFESILLKYSDCITYIKWQPIEDGKIIYGQDESVKHCILHYGHDNTWIAFFDLDEFIFSVKNIYLPDYLKLLDSNVSCIKLIQKKFLDHHLTKESLLTQEFQCINDLEITTDWGAKNIVKCSDQIGIHTIHNIYVSGSTIVPPIDVFRFNHYNVNHKQLEWMKSFYKTTTDFKINGIDDGMYRYKHIFNSM